ncbi:MAG: prepilin-type N-terminal cleavage/methylation domain-containing protein [Phycisphaerae bacterium]
MKLSQKKAFTLIELLVTTSIISLLLGVLVPALNKARGQCRFVVCKSNIRQLYIANHGYSIENNGFYVRAAYDIYDGAGGRNRWHGVRQSSGPHSDPEKNTFDPLKGPLRMYLSDGKVKQCSAIIEFLKEGIQAFESGCGGYGYNSVGVGSRTYKGDIDPMRSSMRAFEITNPNQKVMFTDAAFMKNGSLIEYSFAEPPKAVVNFGTGPREAGRMQPSIHFRHMSYANVVWCDGHVSGEQLDFPESKKSEPAQFKIGWFGPDDNSLFKP